MNLTNNEIETIRNYQQDKHVVKAALVGDVTTNNIPDLKVQLAGSIETL